MVKANIYTKDGFVKTPNGKEYIDLDSALRAYNLSKEVFMERLETGCTLREAFNGLDLVCGLKRSNDGKFYDGEGNGFNTIEDMCEYHHAEVEWFEKLYACTRNIKFSLEQPEKAKNDEYVRKLQLKREQLIKKRLEDKQRETDVKKKKAAIQARVNKARNLLKEYTRTYLESFELIPIEIAWQILRLSEFIESNTSLKYDERRLCTKAENSIKYGETNVLGYADIPNHQLVKDILKDFVCKRMIKKPSLAAMSAEEKKALRAFWMDDYGVQVKKKVSKKELEDDEEDGANTKQRAPALNKDEIMRKVREIHEQEMIEMRKRNAVRLKEEQEKIEERKKLQKELWRKKREEVNEKDSELRSTKVLTVIKDKVCEKTVEDSKDIRDMETFQSWLNEAFSSPMDMLYKGEDYTETEREAADIISVYAKDWGLSLTTQKI